MSATATAAASRSAEQVAAYHRDGFAIARGWFRREEIATRAEEAARVFAREDLNAEFRSWLKERDADKGTADTVFR